MSKPTKQKQLKNCLNLNSEQSFSIVFRGVRTMNLVITDQVIWDEIVEAFDQIKSSATEQVLRDVEYVGFVTPIEKG